MSVHYRSAKRRRMRAAAAELQSMIQQSYPDATFETYWGEDPCGLHLRVTVDIDDTDDIIDLIIRRLVDIQVEEHLPVYVVAVQPLERVLAELQARR